MLRILCYRWDLTPLQLSLLCASGALIVGPVVFLLAGFSHFDATAFTAMLVATAGLCPFHSGPKFKQPGKTGRRALLRIRVTAAVAALLTFAIWLWLRYGLVIALWAPLAFFGDCVWGFVVALRNRGKPTADAKEFSACDDLF